MCGICGVIGEVDAGKKRMLLLLNEQRGKEGTGIICDGKKSRWEEAPSQLLKEGRIPESMFQGKVFVAHTRAASRVTGVGSRSKKNTHPFTSGNITGAHNGYISNWKTIVDNNSKEHPHVKNFDVDSQVIFFLLNKVGIEGFEELCGYGSVWWTDKREPDALFLWVFNQVLSMSSGPGYLAFSSDAEHLTIAGLGNRKKGNKTIKLAEKIGQVLKINTETLAVEKIAEVKAKAYEPRSTAETGGVGCSPFQYHHRASNVPSQLQLLSGIKPDTPQDHINNHSHFRTTAQVKTRLPSITRLIWAANRIIQGETNLVQFCDECKELVVAVDVNGIMNSSQNRLFCSSCQKKAISVNAEYVANKVLGMLQDAGISDYEDYALSVWSANMG